MATVDLISQKKMNKTISHLPGVIGAVRMQAQKIGAKAEARLETVHTPARESEITITYGEVDSFVNLDDPDNALSIEFGHILYINGKRTGKYIPGKYIITGAAGLI